MLLAVVAAVGCSANREVADDREIGELLDTLGHGAPEKLPTIAYGYDGVSAGAQKTLVLMLSLHRAPPTQAWRIRNRQREGCFELLILQAPWHPNEFLPVILGREGSTLRVVGHVLPFDDLVPFFSPVEMKQLQTLGSHWVQWAETNKNSR